MSTLQLTVPLQATQLKAAGTDVQTGTRTIHYYAAAFGGRPDKHRHVVDERAFDEWLTRFYAEGQAHRISFNHAAILAAEDPTNTIGYAPADPDHVYVDDYGLAIKGLVNTTTEKGKAVEWQVEHGLLKGASLAMQFDMTNTRREKDGTLRILKVDRVLESGLVPNPANQGAVLMWMKSEGMTAEEAEQPYMTVAEFAVTVQKQHDALVAVGAECKHDDVEIDLSEDQTNTTVVADPSDPFGEIAKNEAPLSEEQQEKLSKAEQVLEDATPLLSDEDREIQRRFRYLEITNGK